MQLPHVLPAINYNPLPGDKGGERRGYVGVPRLLLLRHQPARRRVVAAPVWRGSLVNP